MTRRFLPLAGLLVLAIRCASAPAPPPAAPPFAPAGTAARVVLISFDGLAADDVEAYGPTLAHLATAGTEVRRIIPVNPTETFPTHVAILTGAPPEKNGIVANRFHLPGTPMTQTTRGVEANIDSETIVEAARRSGKRVGSIAFATLDGTTPRRSADFGLPFAQTILPSRTVVLERNDFHAAWLPPGWGTPPSSRRSFSPVMRARREWPGPEGQRSDLDVVAYDTSDDQTVNYDTLAIEIDGHETTIDASGWFPRRWPSPEGLCGSWSKILSADPSLQRVTIYLGAVSRSRAYPESFRKLMEDENGFWPGSPDEVSIRRTISGEPGIDAETFIEQNDRLSRYLERATTIALTRMPCDLLLTYQTAVDVAQHQFRIVLDSQKNATPANRATGERVRAAAFAAVERVVVTVSGQLDPQHDALLITGDHGLAAVDTEVHLAPLLREWRLADHWYSFGGGNVADFYRDSGSEGAEVLIRKLRELRTPDGQPVFERVERKTAGMHPNSGDVIGYAWPHIVLSAADGETFVQPPYYGQHGGLSSHHEFHTLFVAWGAGVAKERFESQPQTRIARYVARLLGIPPPKDAE